MVTPLLLILAATLECNGQLDHPEAAVIDAIQGVGHAIECFGDSTQESLRLHRQNSDALTDLHSLHSLPDMMLQVKEQLTQQNGNIDSMKKEVAALHRVASLTQEIEALKVQLKSRDETVTTLTQGIADLKKGLEDKNKTVRNLEESLAESRLQVKILSDAERTLNTTTEQLTGVNAELEMKLANRDKVVQELEGRLLETQQRLQQLENITEQQKKTVETRNCCQPNQREITKKVQEFRANGDWRQLRTSLEGLVANNSEVYGQLQTIGYSTSWPLYWVGRHGHTQLASLFLCSGLPVDSADEDGDAMLHGAAVEGQLEVVKLLLDHGASVNMRGSDNSTPLMKAALYRGSLDVVQMLVEAGADTTERDDSSRTALDLAMSKDRTEIVQYLEQHPH